MLHRIVQVLVFSMVPWLELKFSIPFGITKGLHPVVAFLCAVGATWAVIVPMFLVLDLFYHRFLARVGLIHQGVEEIRTRTRSYVERYGVLGIAIYVSLPLPLVGVYSGVIAAWLFALPRRQAIAAVALGVVVSAIQVTLISAGVIAIIRRFVP